MRVCADYRLHRTPAAFLKRNGVFRLALFETPMQEVSGLRALPPADEQRCLAQFDLLPEEGRAVTA